VTESPVPYPAALQVMDARVEAILDGRARELVWLVEHPPLYTAGSSAQDGDLIDPGRFPVYRSGRGNPRRYRSRAGLAAAASLALYRRHQRETRRPAGP
jgi:lipoyl(octanoyl) transferase